MVPPITRVEVAILAVTNAGCRPVRTLGATFTRASPANCTAPVWLRANGTAHWRLRLRRPLPKGRYVVEAQAFDAKGDRSPLHSGTIASQRLLTVR